MEKVFKTELLFSSLGDELEAIISKIDNDYFKETRWFQQKSADILRIKVKDYGYLSCKEVEKFILPTILEFHLSNEVEEEEFIEKYYFPLLITKKKKKRDEWMIVKGKDYEAYVYDGVNELCYVRAMEEFMQFEEKTELQRGGRLKGEWITDEEISGTRQLTDVSSNSITLVKKDEIVKTFRRLQGGVNPELEVSLNLQQKTDFTKFPQVKGYVDYRDGSYEYNIALVQEFIESEGDLWAYTQEHLDNLLSHVAQSRGDVNELVDGFIDNYLELTAEVGDTIADLHMALASIEKESFKPREPRKNELEEWYYQVSEQFFRLLSHLKNKEEELEEQKGLILDLLKWEDKIDYLIGSIVDFQDKLGKFIRCHGDLHLEQILKMGSSIVILDFEGEPTRSISERRRKYSPLKDIAGIMRSYNYAVYAGYFNYNDSGNNDERLLSAVERWEQEIIDNFLYHYLQKTREKACFLPEQGWFIKSIALFKLEKALYEALYEVNNRPDWLPIPLRGIIDCLEDLN